MKPQMFGLILLGLITVFSVIAVYLYSWHLTKKRRDNYERAYATMKFYIDYGIVSPEGYKFLKHKFNEISTDPHCNREKCQVLENEFYKKYHEIIIAEHERN